MKIWKLMELKASKVSDEFETFCTYKGLTFRIHKEPSILIGNKIHTNYCYKCNEEPNDIFLNGSHYSSLEKIKTEIKEYLDDSEKFNR